jgi:hypothetical protein
MNERQCPDDLLVAARSRWLSDLERQVLATHLGRCEACRAGELAAGLFRDPLFAGEPASDADRALVERVADRASASVARGARHAHPGWRRVAVAAAVFLGLGGVASAWIGRSWVAPRAIDRDPPAIDSGPTAGRRARHHDDVERAAASPPPVATARPAPLPRKVAAARPARDSAAVAASPDTAASLFGDATRARHEGDLRRAVTLYGALRSAFPESDQARVASISMGDLLLRLDEPARALRAFDAYLSTAGTGPLQEEALFGRARCLKALGDQAAEEGTWARLVRDFPGSAYAPAARQRLSELRSAR